MLIRRTAQVEASGEVPHSQALLYTFVSHLLLLRTIPLASRAQAQLPTPSSDLSSALEAFLAPLYQALAASVGQLSINDTVASLDIDGRVWFLLLAEVLKGEQELEELLGATVFGQVEQLWSSLGFEKVDVSALGTAFPAASALSAPAAAEQEDQIATAAEPSLLPYTSTAFSPYLTEVHVSSSDAPTSATIKNALDKDSHLGDEPYWENPKPVLPTHLGGPPPAALDARARKKRDRKEQRFSE